MKKNRKKILEPVFLAIFASLIFSGCDNFMVNAAEFKDELKQEVIIAGAQDVDITIQAESGTGTTSPSGLTTVKRGIEFNISLQEDPDYGFIRWAAYYLADPATEIPGLVSFDNSTARSTKAILNTSDSDVLIQPVCERRPYVVDKEPGDLFTLVVRNYPISINFNKDVDPLTVNFDSIDITGRLDGTITDPESVESYFDDPVVNGRTVTIGVNTALPAGWRIFVSLDDTIADTSGLTMSDQDSWKYIVNSDTDTDVPTIVSLQAGTGTSAGSAVMFAGGDDTHRTGNAGENLYLAVNASDSSGVQNLFITETRIYDASGAIVSEAYPQTILAYSSASAFAYPLQSSEDGVIRLDVKVTDVNGNESAVHSYIVIRDTTAPYDTANASQVITSGGSGGYYGDTVNFNAAALYDIGTDGPPYRTRSDLVEWAFSFDGGTSYSSWQNYSGGSTVNIPVTVLDGNVDIFVKFRDDQENETAGQALGSINKDGTDPLISSADIQGLVEYNSQDYIPSTSVMVDIEGTDNPGSGVTHYVISDSSSEPSAGWTSIGGPFTTASFTGSYTASQGSNTLYLWLRDQAGNVSASEEIGTVIIDSLGPHSLSVSPSGANIHQDGNTYYSQASSITFTPSALDDGTAVDGYSTNGPDITAEVADGDTFSVNASDSLTFYAIDMLSNVSATSLTVSVLQDTTPPVCASVNRSVAGFNGYSVFNSGSLNYYHDARLTFTPSDGSGSGVAAYALSTESNSSLVPGGEWTSYAGSGSATIDLPEITAADDTLYLHLRDNVGLENAIDIGDGGTWISDTVGPGQPSLNLGSSDFTYDDGSDYYYNASTGDVNAAFTASDPDIATGISGSGIAGYAETSSGTPQTPLPLGPDTDITVYAIDNVGNASSTASSAFDVIRDSDGPDMPGITSLDVAYGYDVSGTGFHTYYFTGTGDVEVDLSSSDSGSGLDGFSTNTIGVEGASALTLSQGSHSVYALDNAGNASSALVISLYQDITGPTTPVVVPDMDDYYSGSIYYTKDSGNTTITFSATDDGSGLQGFSKVSDGSGISATSLNLSISETAQTVYAMDNMDNASSALTISKVVKDTEVPTITPPAPGTYGNSVSGFSTVDAAGGCGIDPTAYSSSLGIFDGTTLSGLPPLGAGASQDIIITARDYLDNSVDLTVRITGQITPGIYTVAFP